MDQIPPPLMKVAIITDAAPRPIGPYSQAIKFGNFIYGSGQLGLDPQTGELNGSGVAAEIVQLFENIKAILIEAECGFDDVISTTIYLRQISDFTAVNEIYATYFAGVFPARTTVEVSALPKGASVEISFIAGLGG